MDLQLTTAILPYTILAQVKDAVKLLAKQYPDARYQRPTSGVCEYASGTVKNGPDTEGCIVGQAIREVAPEYVDKIRYSKSSAYGLFGYSDNTEYVAKWISTVQVNQDVGRTWGEAVDIANHSVY